MGFFLFSLRGQNTASGAAPHQDVHPHQLRLNINIRKKTLPETGCGGPVGRSHIGFGRLLRHLPRYLTAPLKTHSLPIQPRSKQLEFRLQLCASYGKQHLARMDRNPPTARGASTTRHSLASPQRALYDPSQLPRASQLTVGGPHRINSKSKIPIRPV